MDAYSSNYDRAINITIDATSVGYSVIDELLLVLAEIANENLAANQINNALEVLELAAHIKKAVAERKAKDQEDAAAAEEEAKDE